MRLVLACLLIASACKQPDDAEVVQPLESTLGSAVPAAYFATVAMASLDGRPSPCANVVTPGGSGGPIRVEVGLGANCPPMFGADERGTVVVTGTWTPTLGQFVMDFTGVDQGGSGMLVVGIGAMTVVPNNSTHLTIAYGEEDILIATGAQVGAGIDQIAWVVDVDTHGTDTPTDDTLTVNGGDQSLLAATGGNKNPQADITQVALGNAVFNPNCRKNPNAGLAAVQRAGTRGGGWILYSFHSSCDGTTDVIGAMAPYELMLGKKVELAFLDQ